MRSMPRVVSLAVLLLLIMILGTTFFQVIAPFMLPLFLAGMTAVVCQPLYRYFLSRTGNRLGIAAGITTFSLMAAILVPLVTGVLIASLQLYTFAHTVSNDKEWQKLLSKVRVQAQSGSESAFERAVEFGNQFLPAEKQLKAEQVAEQLKVRIRDSLNKVGDRSLGVAGTTVGVLAGAAGTVVKFSLGLVIFALALFYFLADGTNLLRGAQQLIPVHADYQRELLEQFAKVVRSVVVATFLAALAQGVATAIGLWLLGFSHVFVLFVLATLFALVPLIGTWVVWMPCAASLFLEGHIGSGLFLVLYGSVFVGTLDNIVRAYVLNTDTKLHPLLAFISVVGGLQVMGLWGVFIGPIVASCLHALVKIFNHELFQLSKDRLSPGYVTATGSEAVFVPAPPDQEQASSSAAPATAARAGGSGPPQRPASSPPAPSGKSARRRKRK
ncbi:MAG: AI-2E family transporter [Planctomycetaceae bacterium]|nr:AI-2E family transporter [Planctomycetaceae bacterium]